MTAPSIVSGDTSKTDSSNQTTRTINVPTYAAGDIIVLAVATDANTTGTISSPDFSDYIYQDRPIKTGGGSTVAHATVMWKVAGSEGSTYTINTSVSERIGAMCFAIRGADVSALHSIATEALGDSGTATVPAVTTTVNDCLRISIVGCDGTTQTTPHGTATNHTKLGEAWFTSSGAVSVHYKTIPTATTDGAETVSLAASFRWIGFSFTVAPAAGGVSVEPAAASAVASAVAPTVVLGALTLTPAAASAVAASVAPTVIAGVVMTPDAASAASGAISPTVIAAVVMTPDAASAASGAGDPVVDLGALVLTPDAASAASGAGAPVVVLGALAITPVPASAVAGVVAPEVVILVISAYLTLKSRALVLTVGDRDLGLTLARRDLGLTVDDRDLSLSLNNRVLTLTLKDRE